MFPDFEKVLKGAIGGDRPSLQTLVGWYWPHLRRFLQIRIRDRDQADDILQDFFSHLVSRRLLERFRGSNPVELRNFLMSCLSNFSKTTSSRVNQNGALSIEELENGERRWVKFIAVASSEEAFFHAEVMAALKEATMELPLDYRRVVRLSLDGYTHEEIGGMLGIPRNTVSSHIHRAKDLLRSSLIARGVQL